jgi:PPM family protein phosphatase
MKKLINGVFSFKKNLGKTRVTNEDDCQVVVNSRGNVLLIVCDGMGGHLKGDFASSQTVKFICDEFKNKSGFLSASNARVWLTSKIKKINAKLFEQQDSDSSYRGMGTTLVCALIINNKLIIVNCGDSRCYLLENNLLNAVTEDDSYVNYLHNIGQISEKEMSTSKDRHIITNAIGLFPSASFEVKTLAYNGETIFLCSDGLYNEVSLSDMQNILKTNDAPEVKVSSLIQLANFNGGSDNISCCLWESIHD